MVPQGGRPERIQVFISHQWRDKQVADRLARDLERMADVWLDFRNLRPGDRIQARIDEALGRMDLVLLLWSRHAKASDGVQEEIRKSLELHRRLVPVFLEYDGAGRPSPPLEPPLSEILGVDLHHYGTGLAQIAHLVMGVQGERLPEAVRPGGDHPGVRMLEHLRGYLSYLANYRSLTGVEDERAEWIDRIIGEIEAFVEAGGDRSTVHALLEVARRSEVNDPEGVGALVSRLERLLGEGGRRPVEGGAGSPSADELPLPDGPESADAGPWRTPPPPPPDLLATRVSEVVPSGTADAWLAEVNAYVESAPMVLEAMEAFARSVGSAAGVQVTGYLRAYLQNADDLIPLHHGDYGLLDDAWLILNTAFRLVESGVLPAAVVPLDWPRIIRTDPVVRAVVPPKALSTLEAMVFELLQVIAREVSSYQPWFTPQGHGYAPTMAGSPSGGGSWEDEMNRRLLGTGLSVDG